VGVKMANNEHVAMLGRGAAAWNEWRADCDETPDLSRAGLRGLDLSGFDLSRADLRGADFRGRASGTSSTNTFRISRRPRWYGCSKARVSRFAAPKPLLITNMYRWKPASTTVGRRRLMRRSGPQTRFTNPLGSGPPTALHNGVSGSMN
jgi:Pentapeptide repeats (8 copies)